MLLQQQVAEALLESIDLADCGELLEVELELGPLLRLEVVTMPIQRAQASGGRTSFQYDAIRLCYIATDAAPCCPAPRRRVHISLRRHPVGQ
jgi:hypothetical protein